MFCGFDPEIAERISSLLGSDAVRISSAGPHPLVHFGNLELPKAPDPMGGQVPPFDPAVNRISRDTQVSGYVVDRRPGFRHAAPPSLK
jgi:hypothetical protein